MLDYNGERQWRVARGYEVSAYCALLSLKNTNLNEKLMVFIGLG